MAFGLSHMNVLVVQVDDEEHPAWGLAIGWCGELTNRMKVSIVDGGATRSCKLTYNL